MCTTQLHGTSYGFTICVNWHPRWIKWTHAAESSIRPHTLWTQVRTRMKIILISQGQIAGQLQKHLQFTVTIWVSGYSWLEIFALISCWTALSKQYSLDGKHSLYSVIVMSCLYALLIQGLMSLQLLDWTNRNRTCICLFLHDYFCTRIY